MATKKKTKKKSARSKKSKSRKSPAQKARTPRKSAKRKTAPKKVAQKKTAKTIRTKTQRGVGLTRQKEMQQPGSSTFSRDPSGQAGDLQGLSNVESVDSESVDELLEEGNAFEAGVISGVEESGKREGKEVRTREVPEDDVPEEYREKE